MHACRERLGLNPGNANLLIGGFRNANQEIGVPGDTTLRLVNNQNI
jgi:hypothetical protein